MPDIVHVKYQQTGKSKSTNALGMREMQQKALRRTKQSYNL
ncbi:hypothetical protein [uncultured Polaribacter sp.]|nr:hypothetical protein [uncultured Polaribacter sp.]